MTKQHQDARGFHLLEILIVLMIMIIMSQWMFVNYQQFLARGKRHAAASALYTLSSALEDYALQHGSYRQATFSALGVSEFAVNHQYQLLLERIDDQYFQIGAQPLANQARIDSACGKLMLSSTGVKSVSGNKSVEECF